MTLLLRRTPLPMGVGVALALSCTGCGLLDSGAGEEEEGKQLAAAVLIDPTSAQFRDVHHYRHVVCGQVNGKNRMGAYVGFSRFIADIEKRNALIDPQYEPVDGGLDDESKRLAQLEFNISWSEKCGPAGFGVSGAEPFDPTRDRPQPEENWSEQQTSNSATDSRKGPAASLAKPDRGTSQLVDPDGNPLVPQSSDDNSTTNDSALEPDDV
jgi:hypothetical protein